MFWIKRGGALHPRPKDRGFTPLSTPHSYKLTTKTLPEKLDVLPAMTKERFDRVRTWRNRLDKAARNLILKAYPDAKIDKNFIEVID